MWKKVISEDECHLLLTEGIPQYAQWTALERLVDELIKGENI